MKLIKVKYMINKKNIPLILALCIPVLMIILVAAFIYFPGMGKKAQYSFVYMTGASYYDYGQREYEVVNGKVTYYPLPSSTMPLYGKPDNVKPHFYFYDINLDSATEISFEQAKNYNLDSSNISPDNYVIERGNGGGGLFFDGGTDYNSWFIKGYNRSRKLNLKLTGTDSYYNFRFLGWVK